MKELVLKIKLQSNSAAGRRYDIPDDMPVTFERDAEECILLRHNHLFAMLTAAKHVIGSPLDIRQFFFNSRVSAPTVQSVIKVPEAGIDRVFEQIPAGEEIYLTFRAPEEYTNVAIRELFTAAGVYVGLSAFGHKAGYGRFTVLSLATCDDSSDTEQEVVPDERNRSAV